MTDEDRADCAVCAALLHASRVWEHLALAATLLGAVAASLPVPRVAVLIGLAVLAALERYLAVRVAIDARLFDRLADGRLGDLPRLDGALQRVLAVPASKAGRALAPRIAGARRLARLHLAAVGALVAAAIVIAAALR